MDICERSSVRRIIKRECMGVLFICDMPTFAPWLCSQYERRKTSHAKEYSTYGTP